MFCRNATFKYIQYTYSYISSHCSNEVKRMADEHKGIALVILGIVAVIAVVGLVLLFVQGKSATGEGVYGGALKKVAYPYWTGRGVPRNTPGVEYPLSAGRDMQTNWNWFDDSNNRNPVGDVPSALTGCETGGWLESYNNAPYYQSLGYTVVKSRDKPGVCIYPNTPMVGGVV
jgi:hypothetical protein